MTSLTWMHFGHLLSAMVLLGGSLLLYLDAIRARRGDAHAVTEFTRTLAYVGPRAMLPSVLGTVVFGIALVAISPAWGFGQLWIMAGAGLFLLALLVGTVYLSRIGMALQKVGDSAEQGRALIQKWIGGYRVVLVVLLIALGDMVFKPGA